VIYVSADNACGSSSIQSLSVNVNEAPAQPSNISGNTSVCAGSSNTYTVTAVPGATSYTWTFPSGWSGNSSTNSIVTTAGANGGNVTVIATNACGSSTAQSLSVTISPDPTAGFTSSSNLLSVSFTDISTGATSWAWDFGDQNTSTLQNPSHTYATAGTYNVCLTATANGCSNTICHTVTVIAVGVENGIEFQVSVAPNPSTGIFRLACEENLQGMIFDAQGRMVSEARYDAGVHSIDLTGVTDGVYLLKLNNESSIHWVKLLKVTR
jgi:PKD repeat protein